jgi:pimeloyl-ACP methyl ester carboxylesterase
MRQSESRFLEVRGLRYHLRHWPAPGAPKLVLLHGWMDVSASFQFVVDALEREWDVVAPDWRGYGLTQWAKADSYWFPDYLADLDLILQRADAEKPINLVGHSMGGHVAGLYAGVRPARVARFVNLEGFGLAATRPEQAPKRYARWLDELRVPPRLRPYESFGALAERIRSNNPRLSPEKAEFLARHWGQALEGDGVTLRSDPAHKIVNPVLYRQDEVRACWQLATAPVLWVEAADSDALKRVGLDAAAHAERRAAFRTLRYVTVPGSGHMLHHDQPEAVARLLEEFCAR